MSDWESNEEIGADYSSEQFVYESTVINTRDDDCEYEFGVHYQCAPRVRKQRLGCDELPLNLHRYFPFLFPLNNN